MKKSIISVLLIASLCCLAGCEKNENISIDNTPADTTVSETVAEEEGDVTEEAVTENAAETSAVSETSAETEAVTSATENDLEHTGVSIASLNGLWTNDGEYPDRLIFEDGRFYLISGYSSMMVTGDVKIEEANSTDGTYSHCYVLHDDIDGEIIDSFPVTGEIPFNSLVSSGNTGYYSSDNGNFSRNFAENEYASCGEDYYGDWQGPRPYIEISPLDDGIEVMCYWGSSAWDTTVFNYKCKFDEVSKKLVCDGGATRVDIHTDENGTTEDTVYTDGSAEFTLKYGVIFWNDRKDHSADEYAFIKQ